MKIREILARKGRDVVTIEGERTVLEAVRRLVEHDIGALVVTVGERPVGIFTERDVLRLTARRPGELDSVDVGAVMTADPVTTKPEADLHEMMGVMTRRRIRHLPVLENGRLAGIVSIGDLLNAGREVAEQENHHLRRYIHGGA